MVAPTAEQRAAPAHVSMRTVRYSVQEGLIEAPGSCGPDAHFTNTHLVPNTHLAELLRIRGRADARFDLETINEFGRRD